MTSARTRTLLVTVDLDPRAARALTSVRTEARRNHQEHEGHEREGREEGLPCIEGGCFVSLFHASL